MLCSATCSAFCSSGLGNWIPLSKDTQHGDPAPCNQTVIFKDAHSLVMLLDRVVKTGVATVVTLEKVPVSADWLEALQQEITRQTPDSDDAVIEVPDGSNTIPHFAAFRMKRCPGGGIGTDLSRSGTPPDTYDVRFRYLDGFAQVHAQPYILWETQKRLDGYHVEPIIAFRVEEGMLGMEQAIMDRATTETLRLTLQSAVWGAREDPGGSCFGAGGGGSSSSSSSSGVVAMDVDNDPGIAEDVLLGVSGSQHAVFDRSSVTHESIRTAVEAMPRAEVVQRLQLRHFDLSSKPAPADLAEDEDTPGLGGLAELLPAAIAKAAPLRNDAGDDGARGRLGRPVGVGGAHVETAARCARTTLYVCECHCAKHKFYGTCGKAQGGTKKQITFLLHLPPVGTPLAEPKWASRTKTIPVDADEEMELAAVRDVLSRNLNAPSWHAADCGSPDWTVSVGEGALQDNPPCESGSSGSATGSSKRRKKG